jgi:hypothetical protein
MEEGESAFKILTCKPTGMGPAERLRHNWEGNISIDIKQISFNSTHFIGSTQDADYWRALANMASNHGVSYCVYFH